jgi:hypothetical protein
MDATALLFFLLSLPFCFLSVSFLSLLSTYNRCSKSKTKG